MNMHKKFILVSLMIIGNISLSCANDFISLGNTFYSINMFKSTNVGSFERYLAPELSKFTTFNLNFDKNSDFKIDYPAVTTDRNFDIIGERFEFNNLPFQNSKSILFPDGGYKNKFNYKISFNPGYAFSINKEIDLNTPIYNNLYRIGVSCFYDINKVKIEFPTGVGILTDPTSASGKNIFQGFSYFKSI